MTSKTTSDVLQRARDTLATAKLGLRDVVEGGPERRLGGLRNLVVFGRAVTNVVQNLKSIEPAFDRWYAPYVAEMKDFNFPQDMQRLGPPPPGATAFFMGDQAGGSGWEIRGDNGEIERFYVDIPGDIATFEVHLPDAPITHKGQTIRDKQIQTLAQLYFDYLSNMVDNARRKFGAQDA